MKPIRIFRHVACEGPGYFATVLENYHIPYDIVRVDAGETPPPQLDDISAVVFMGGPMSVNDDLPWIAQELDIISRAVASDLPVLGHCLGGQLISKALGGTISANPVKEIGWLPVQKLDNPAAHDWLADMADDVTLFHWHGETFSIPQGANPVLKSRHCSHQGFVMGNTLALQCHVEMNADMVQEWANRYRDELSPASATVQSPEQMTENLEEKIRVLHDTADALYRRWLQPMVAIR
jgi:GMP synthase-like glutamine amidotransferase